MTEQQQMRQRTRPPRMSAETSEMFGNLRNDGVSSGLVAVSHGIYAGQFPVAGMTVRQIRERFAVPLDIDPSSTATIGSARVPEDTVVHEGQALAFFRNGGEKGAGFLSGRQVA